MASPRYTSLLHEQLTLCTTIVRMRGRFFRWMLEYAKTQPDFRLAGACNVSASFAGFTMKRLCCELAWRGVAAAGRIRDCCVKRMAYSSRFGCCRSSCLGIARTNGLSEVLTQYEGVLSGTRAALGAGLAAGIRVRGLARLHRWPTRSGTWTGCSCQLSFTRDAGLRERFAR